MELSEIDARLQRLAHELVREGAAPIDIVRTLMKIGVNVAVALGGNRLARDELDALSAHLDRPGATIVALATAADLKGGRNGNQKIN